MKVSPINLTSFLKPSIMPLLGILILLIIPALVPRHITSLLLLSFIFTIFAASWDLLYGFAGQLSLGHGFPFGLGAFLAVILIIQFGFPLWGSLIVASLWAGSVSMVVALPALRLRGIYLAITTLALMIVAGQTALITTTEEGYPGFLVTWPYPMQRFFNGDILPNYYLALFLMVASLSIMLKIGRSSLGIKFQAIREDPMVAQSLGINVTKYKLLAFWISSIFASLAGAYYALYLGHADYTYFSPALFFTTLGMVVVGGLGTIVGAFFGSLIFEALSVALGAYGAFRLIFLGLIVILSILFLPLGILSAINRVTERAKSITSRAKGRMKGV